MYLEEKDYYDDDVLLSLVDECYDNFTYYHK